MLTLNMNKAAQGLRLALAKAGINTPPQAEVAFDLDVSGSFDDEHRAGLTQGILARLVPWGMVFDPDQKLDVFTFASGERGSHHVGDVTVGTLDDYIARNIIDRVPGYNGRTDYSYVLEKNLQHFGWLSAPAAAPAKSGGLFGGLFGGKKQETAATVAAPVKKRSIVFFVTDGANDDKPRTRQVLRDSANRGDQVYFLFIGCSNQGAGAFPFIKELGDEFPNVGFVPVTNIEQFTSLDDDALNALLIGDELVQWLKK